MRFPIYSLLIPTLLFLVLSSVEAHSSPSSTHVRRALSNKLQRRLSLSNLPGALLSDPANSLGLGDNDDPPSADPSPIPPSDTPPPTPTPTTDSDINSSTSTTATTDSDTNTSTSTAAPQEPTTPTGTTTTSSSTEAGTPDTTSLLDPTSISASDSSTSVPDTATPTPTPTSDSTSPSSTESTSVSTSSDNCSGGGLLGNLLNGLLCTSTSPPTSTSEAATSVPPTSDPNTSVPPTSDPNTSVPPTTDPVTSTPSSEPTPPPTPTSVPTSSDACEGGGLLGGLLCTATSIILPPTSTPDPVTSSPPPVTSAPSSEPTPPPTPTSEPTPSATCKDDLLNNILCTVTSVVLPPTSTPITSATPDPPVSDPTSNSPSSTPTAGPTSESPSSPVTEPPTSSPTISFPTGSISESGGVSASLTDSTITSQPTQASSISINSDLSWILTESSLAFASIPTSVVEQTLTDPDQATTTVIDSQAGPTPATTLSIAALPSGIPNRIYPKVQLDMSQDLSGYTMISILFNQELNWAFVASSTTSSSQIFAWLPAIIHTALDISADQVKTWALQVYIPASYHSATDVIQLGTMWLGYIPSDQVDNLAAQIKAKQSLFYNGVNNNVAKALASHVNSGFSLNAVADPNLNTNGGGSSNGSGSNSGSSKTRQDAIIGVVSALGAIALLVLVFLVYRSMKRRRELAHRRLSDPPDQFVAGARPDGREFDQDSVGGARRRSFYYAEDSLRTYQPASSEEHYDSRSGPPGMVQRRNVMPAAISAPILQESSMNW